MPDKRASDRSVSISSADPSRDLPSPRRDVVNVVSALMIEAIKDIFSILLILSVCLLMIHQSLLIILNNMHLMIVWQIDNKPLLLYFS